MDERCGISGADLEWYLACNGQTLLDRIMPYVMQQNLNIAIRSANTGRGFALNPLEMSLAFMREWASMSAPVMLRFVRYWERENRAIVERHRQLVLEKQGRRPKSGAPGARGRARPKPRKKSGRR